MARKTSNQLKTQTSATNSKNNTNTKPKPKAKPKAKTHSRNSDKAQSVTTVKSNAKSKAQTKAKADFKITDDPESNDEEDEDGNGNENEDQGTIEASSPICIDDFSEMLERRVEFQRDIANIIKEGYNKGAKKIIRDAKTEIETLIAQYSKDIIVGVAVEGKTIINQLLADLKSNNEPYPNTMQTHRDLLVRNNDEIKELYESHPNRRDRFKVERAAFILAKEKYFQKTKFRLKQHSVLFDDEEAGSDRERKSVVRGRISETTLVNAGTTVEYQ